MASIHPHTVLLSLRWVARIVGAVTSAVTVAVVLIAAIATGGGEHLPNPLAWPVRFHLLTLALLTTAAGLLVGWKWEGTGGLLAIGGLAFLAVVAGDFPPNSLFWPTLGAGLSYLLCGCLGRWNADPPAADRSAAAPRNLV